MFRKPQFFGSTTVNSRGQIVLPAELRKELDIKPGDKLVVMATCGKREHSGQVTLLKAEFLTELLERLEVGQNMIRDFLSKNGDGGSGGKEGPE
ncbi:MAG: AbrB/MazE/SpoVT family DNA-binding domain-containing protein [Promethearchaeota archaeon]